MSSNEVDRLQRAARTPLPPDYVAFLERHTDFFGDDDVVTSADGLAEFYEESVHSGETIVPPDCIVFAVSGLSFGKLVMETMPPHRVFQLVDGANVALWADSFRGFVEQQAFRRCVRQSRHWTALTSLDTEPRRSRAEDLFETLGLERLSFSDSVTLCGQSADVKVMVQQMAGQGVRVRLGCRGWIRLWRLKMRVASALDLPLLPRPIPRHVFR